MERAADTSPTGRLKFTILSPNSRDLGRMTDPVLAFVNLEMR